MSNLPAGVVGTGVYATEEEQKKLQELEQEARRTPVMLVGTVSLAHAARDRVLRAVHKAALEHGLPEITGYYGLAQDGEFVRAA